MATFSDCSPTLLTQQQAPRRQGACPWPPRPLLRPLTGVSSPMARAPLLKRLPRWAPPSRPPLQGFLVAACRPRSSDHFPLVYSLDLRCRGVDGGLATVPAPATTACGDYVPCARRLRPVGVGRPKGRGLGRELHQGREATVALGWMEVRVNSRFWFFLLDFFQINFEYGSNSIDFVSCFGFCSNYLLSYPVLCQNQVLIICMTQDQLFHTYGQKCSQITKCHEYNV
jgi:hypothetical protein